MKTIKLTRGKVALVDDEDFEFISRWKWRADVRGYAMRTSYAHGKYSPQLIRMSRLVAERMGLVLDGLVVDHINGRPGDNRRENLRAITQANNCKNARLRKDSASGVKGVSYCQRDRYWLANISVDGVKHSLGGFKLKEDAVQAYAEAARRLHGEFACISHRGDDRVTTEQTNKGDSDATASEEARTSH